MATTKINRSKFQRALKAMQNKAIELGFKTILAAENAGFSNQLKSAFENAK